MGVLNVTPDSFSDGGKFASLDCALARAMQMIDEGVDVIDVGGESSRPFAPALSLEAELTRVIPVIEQLRKLTDLPISVDTYKPDVMRRACDVGATMINDIKALREPGALQVAAECNVPVVLMHMQNDPLTMQNDPIYEDVVKQVGEFFEERMTACLQAGIKKDNLILDPGFGFGKTEQHNALLLRSLEYYQAKWGLPLLVGFSRKSMIGRMLGLPVEQRLYPSLALAVYAAMKGAKMIRVHDVLATRQAIDMIAAVEAV